MDLAVIWAQNLSPVFFCLMSFNFTLMLVCKVRRGIAFLPFYVVKAPWRENCLFQSMYSLNKLILRVQFNYIFLHMHQLISCKISTHSLFVFRSGWMTSSSAKRSQGWRRSCRSLSQFQVNWKAVAVLACGVCHILFDLQAFCWGWASYGFYLPCRRWKDVSQLQQCVFFWPAITSVAQTGGDSTHLQNKLVVIKKQDFWKENSPVVTSNTCRLQITQCLSRLFRLFR